MNRRIETGTRTREGLAQIEQQIQRRLGGRVCDLRVVVRDDGQVLQCRSRTHHARHLAQQTTMEMSELPILANEIRV